MPLSEPLCCHKNVQTGPQLIPSAWFSSGFVYSSLRKRPINEQTNFSTRANRKDSHTRLKWLKVNTCIQVGKKFYTIFTPGVFVFDSIRRYLLSHWWEKQGSCFLRGSEERQHHRRQPQKHQCHPHCRHNLSSFHLWVEGWQRWKDDSHPHQPREHCEHLYQHFIKKKISPSCGAKICKVSRYCCQGALEQGTKGKLVYSDTSPSVMARALRVLMWRGCENSRFSSGD